MTWTTFEAMRRRLKESYFEVLSLLAVRNTWHCHPRQLLGDPWDEKMMIDEMALEDWIRSNTVTL